MSVFDLLFIVLFLVAISASTTAAWFGLRGKFDRVRRILFRLLVGVGVYMAAVIATSLILPRQVLAIGDPLCFDDWCVSIEGFQRAQEAARARYRVNLRLSNRARRVSQRENNLAVYLTDHRGRRYDPVASNGPFNALLEPQESIAVSRSFVIPADATDVAVVITHEGGFPVGWLIVGYDAWFRKPPIARLQ
jgi:hypothetical protein